MDVHRDIAECRMVIIWKKKKTNVINESREAEVLTTMSPRSTSIAATRSMVLKITY